MPVGWLLVWRRFVSDEVIGPAQDRTFLHRIVAVVRDRAAQPTEGFAICEIHQLEQLQVGHPSSPKLQEASCRLRGAFLAKLDWHRLRISHCRSWPSIRVALPAPCLTREPVAIFRPRDENLAQPIRRPLTGKTRAWMHDIKIRYPPEVVHVEGPELGFPAQRTRSDRQVRFPSPG